MIVALKIDVDTLRGTREGVPKLVDLLKMHDAGASFFFSVGPDRTGRAIRRVFRPGFMRKVQRTSVVQHYGVRTLLYGTLLPGPDIGRRADDVMRHVRDEGFEVGLHSWDHTGWQDGVGDADAAWTGRQMQLGCERFTEIFKEAPLAHAAAGWQMNLHALRLTQTLGFEYCSDGRGSHPHLPVWNAELIRCPQLPTTLPTLDELIGTDGITPENVAERLLEQVRMGLHERRPTMPSNKIADFSVAATGGTFKLADHRGHPVVLYFYPKDNTPGCTTEGSQFRDLHKQFIKAGAVVAGVSRDS